MIVAPEWMDRAACAHYRNPLTGEKDWDLWYPDKATQKGVTPEAAKAERDARRAEAIMVCLSCPVMVECREASLEQEERWGIWAAMDETDRRKSLGLRHWPRRPAVPDHGTEARYAWDIRHGQDPCQDCRQAQNRRHRERKADAKIDQLELPA